MDDQLRNESEWEACCKGSPCCGTCKYYAADDLGRFDGTCDLGSIFSEHIYHVVNERDICEDWER